jgi:hypothetical protein
VEKEGWEIARKNGMRRTWLHVARERGHEPKNAGGL